MVTSYLSDGSVSIDTKFDGSFHQIYPVLMKAISPTKVGLAEDPTAIQVFSHYLMGQFGASVGVVLSDGKQIIQEGTISAGGYILYGAKVTGFIYMKNTPSFTVLKTPGDPCCLLNSLLPTAVQCTPGAKVVGCCPTSYSVVGDQIFENFKAEKILGYPEFVYGTILNGKLVKAFGIKTGSWNLDYMPTTRRGGLKSLLAPQRFSMTGKQYAEDHGVVVMTSSEVSAARAALRDGSKLDGLKALNHVYGRPASDVKMIDAVLYLAARSTAQCYRHYKVKMAIVDPYQAGSILPKSLDNAMAQLKSLNDKYSSVETFYDVSDEELDVALDAFSYLVFDSVEVKEVLASYMSIYNEYLIKQGRIFKQRMYEVVDQYNEAVLNYCKQHISFRSPKVAEIIAKYHLGGITGLDIPIPFNAPYVDVNKVGQLDPENAATVLSQIKTLFLELINDSRNYIGARASTEEEMAKEEYLPIEFYGDDMAAAVQEQVTKVQDDFARCLELWAKTFMMLPGANDWAYTNGTNETAMSSDTDRYDHGCGDICEITNPLFRNPEQFGNQVFSHLPVGTSVVDCVADPDQITPENMYKAGFRIMSIIISNVRKNVSTNAEGVTSGNIVVDLVFTIMNHAGYTVGGLHGFQNRANDFNQCCVQNMARECGFKNPEVTFAYAIDIPHPKVKNHKVDWCSRKSDASFDYMVGEDKRSEYCKPSVFSVVQKNVTVSDATLTLGKREGSANYNSIIDAELDKIRAKAQEMALTYLISALEELGVLADCTWCGYAQLYKQYIPIDTLQAVTSFQKGPATDIEAALKSILNTGKIQQSTSPDDYRDEPSEANKAVQALTVDQRANIQDLLSVLSSLQENPQKVWANKASTLVSSIARDSDIIPFVLKLA